MLEPGLALGYHRPKSGAGTWWVRALVGERQHRMQALGTADGLNWSQAQAAAREWAGKQTVGGPLSIEDACREYVDDLRARKGERPAREAEGRLRKHLLPALGGVIWPT